MALINSNRFWYIIILLRVLTCTDRDYISGSAESPASREADWLLPRRGASALGLPVHAMWQPRESSLHTERSWGVASVVNEDEDSAGSCQGTPISSRFPEAGDLPGFQSFQHTLGLRLYCETIRFWVGERRAGRTRKPCLDQSHGHSWLRCAGVHHDGPPDVEE
ncbi:unnamed protein product [Linum tenue]|uniref:Uncharacterized protein n=1 Tax=Linum tenue TaxID=586396 RepID=A0AAV0KDP9_9ROSI|nr:unnamed protein product [Linum tenue]